MAFKFHFRSKRSAAFAALTAATLGLAVACGGTTTTGGGTTTAESPAAGGTTPASDLTGSVLVDGSSTVFPISEAMAEEFMKANPGVRVTVGVSGTGGGFKKFCAGETDISNASRPIKSEEIELCKQNGIEYVELPIAFDGLTVVVHPDNDFASCLTVDELKKMWEPAAQGTITNWNQIRPDFPNRPLSLYGAGTDSGTYDYFTAAIVGEEGESRGDYTASEDDNVIVQGVSADPNSVGFFGYAYY
ncbi:MAG: PstS family phosphate ABC transporter substrate-binding protein, partial [Cyanobacteria bacterium J069]